MGVADGVAVTATVGIGVGGVTLPQPAKATASATMISVRRITWVLASRCSRREF